MPVPAEYEPTPQFEHAIKPVVEEYVPTAHDAQLAAAVEPTNTDAVPEGQPVQLLDPRLELYWPATQFAHVFPLPYLPAGQYAISEYKLTTSAALSA